MDSIVFWVALSPKQMDDLTRGGVVFPELPPEKFYLSMECTCEKKPVQSSSEKKPVQTSSDPVSDSYWDFSIMQLEISARAYLQKIETGALERVRQGEYWWHGSLQREQLDGYGRVLYHFLEPTTRSEQ